MPDIYVSTTINRNKPDWYHTIKRYERSHPRKAIWQLVNTFIPYLLVSILMYLCLIAGYSYLVILGLGVVAAGLLVRIFIFFHDCAHQSFFASSKANTALGYVCGILTYTPFEEWRKSHGIHHNTAGNLDRRGTGDVWTLTIDEYHAASKLKRFWYRFLEALLCFWV